MKLSLTRRFTFEMAHALSGYDGACRQIHGHSYKLYVTLSGTPSPDDLSPKLGMIMDFTDIKSIVNRTIVERYDHALVLRSGSVSPELLSALKEQWEKVCEVDFQPTCENMIIDMARNLSAELPESVELSELKLYETENSYVTLRP